jgi:hypothetical protein
MKHTAALDANKFSGDGMLVSLNITVVNVHRNEFYTTRLDDGLVRPRNRVSILGIDKRGLSSTKHTD